MVKATRAENDEQLLQSWLDELNSPHARRNFETTARRVIAELPMGLRAAKKEDARDALKIVTHGSARPLGSNIFFEPSHCSAMRTS